MSESLAYLILIGFLCLAALKLHFAKN